MVWLCVAAGWFRPRAIWTGDLPGGYRAHVRILEAIDWRDESPATGWLADWEELDGELVREVDPPRNTAVTGANRCRTWARADVVVSEQVNGVWAHKWDNIWVLNNMVRFR